MHIDGLVIMQLALAATGGLILALVLMVTARKVRRDRRSVRPAIRRQRLEEAISACAAEDEISQLRSVLEAELTSIDAMFDLMRVLLRSSPARPDLVLAAAEGAGITLQLTAWRRHRDPVRRGVAVLLLELLGVPGAVSIAKSAMDDPDSDVRLAAVRALGIRPGTETVAALITGLREPTLASERVVERLANPAAAPFLISELDRSLSAGDRSVPEQAVRAGLARALGLIGDLAAERPLVQLLRAGGGEEQVSAARALGTCGTAASVPGLRRALAQGEAPVRIQAATALGRLRATEAAADLERTLADPNWWLRASSALALSRMGKPGIDILRRVARGGDEFAADRAREQLNLLTRSRSL